MFPFLYYILVVSISSKIVCLSDFSVCDFFSVTRCANTSQCYGLLKTSFVLFLNSFLFKNQAGFSFGVIPVRNSVFLPSFLWAKRTAKIMRFFYSRKRFRKFFENFSSTSIVFSFSPVNQVITNLLLPVFFAIAP
mgnify:CR=1 FL=1